MRRLLVVIGAAMALMVLAVPGSVAADANRVYVAETGHHVQAGFLDFWERNGGPDRFGYPITEEFSEGGVTFQYFQRARFEWRGSGVELGLVAVDLGKGHPRQRNTNQTNQGDGWRYYAESGHFIGGAFYQKFAADGGVDVYGYPISPELSENGRTVQYFQRARMEWTGSKVELGLIGSELASQRGIDTSGVPRAEGVEEWSVARLQTASSVAAPAAPGGGKHIVINLSQQHLWAYENGRVWLRTPVTTGRPELQTLPGQFSVLSKHSPYWFYSPWPQGSPYWYEPALSNYALYYAAGGFFIHDAPWRPYYGPGTNVWHQDPDGEWRTGSHGCVNVPSAVMQQLYPWASVRTRVTITY